MTPAGDVAIVLKSHTSQVHVKKDLHIYGNYSGLILTQQVELIPKFFEKSTTCSGIPVEEGKNITAMLPHVFSTYRNFREETGHERGVLSLFRRLYDHHHL